MEAYKQVRNRTNAMNVKFKKEYFADKIHSCEGNIKDTWSTIDMLIKIADSMKKYFCSIGEELSRDIPYKLNSF